MPAKKKINTVTEYKPKDESNMKRCKQVEEKLNECIDISDEDEQNESNESNETVETKQSISTKSDTKNKYDNIIYSPDTYVLKFGRYKGMKAKYVKNVSKKEIKQ